MHAGAFVDADEEAVEDPLRHPEDAADREHVRNAFALDGIEKAFGHDLAPEARERRNEPAQRSKNAERDAIVTWRSPPTAMPE